MGVKTLKEAQEASSLIYLVLHNETATYMRDCGILPSTEDQVHEKSLIRLQAKVFGSACLLPTGINLSAASSRSALLVQSTALSLYLHSAVSGVFLSKLKSLCICWDTIIDRLVLGACIDPYIYEEEKKQNIRDGGQGDEHTDS